jgi:hypothetical protein
MLEPAHTSQDYNKKVPTTGSIFSPCPLMVQIILECYVNNKPWDKIPFFEWNSNAGRDIRYTLHHYGLINEDHVVTAKGICWVKAITRTPFPTEEKTYKVVYHNG